MSRSIKQRAAPREDCNKGATEHGDRDAGTSSIPYNFSPLWRRERKRKRAWTSPPPMKTNQFGNKTCWPAPGTQCMTSRGLRSDPTSEQAVPSTKGRQTNWQPHGATATQKTGMSKQGPKQDSLPHGEHESCRGDSTRQADRGRASRPLIEASPACVTVRR